MLIGDIVVIASVELRIAKCTPSAVGGRLPKPKSAVGATYL